MQYLAVFETDQGDVCQGLLLFPKTPRLQVFYPPRWFETVARLGQAHLGIPGCQVSIRTSLRCGRLEQLALFRAPASQEHALRHYLTEYLCLIALVPESVALPLDAHGHDAMAQPWASQICRIPPMAYPESPQPTESWFVCDFRVQDMLPELLEEAAASGHDLLHQINFQSWTLTADQARTARHNFVAMEKLRGRGASDALLDLQRRLLFLPEGEVVLASEEVGVASLHDAVWAAQVLERHFKNRRGAMRFDPPAFTFSGGHGSYSQSLHNGSPEAEEMACGIHPALMKPPRIGALFASAVDRDSVGRAFDWSGRMRRWFEPALISEKAILRTNYEKAEEAEKQEDADLSLALAVRPKPLEICTGVSDYAFISYRRSDFSRIEPILDSLNTARIPFWFDRGLIGGEQWMSRLQERISSARNFLLFLSPRAVESRYVQMEVHFAYYLERPLILPVELETTPIHEMPGGLGMILGMHNILPVDTLRIIEDLRKNDLKSGSSRIV